MIRDCAWPQSQGGLGRVEQGPTEARRGAQMRSQLVVSLSAESSTRGGSATPPWFDGEQAHIFDPATGDNLTQYARHAEKAPSGWPTGG
jgi:multiple sugar transport system ATP-binding protein